MKNKLCKKGFTLLEAVISLALFMLLSSGIFFVWQHSARSSAAMLERQNAFENARIVMDVLKMNIQMANEITILANNEDVLQMITLRPRERVNPNDPDNYRFRFNGSPTFPNRFEIGQPGLRGWTTGTWNEMASHIYEIRIVSDGGKIHITVTTNCIPETRITLEGTVCVRYKIVN